MHITQFPMSLANGQNWSLTAYGQAWPLLWELARIMELEQYAGTAWQKYGHIITTVSQRMLTPGRHCWLVQQCLCPSCETVSVFPPPSTRSLSGSSAPSPLMPVNGDLLQGASSAFKEADRRLVLVPLTRAPDNPSEPAVDPWLAARLDLPQDGWSRINLGALRFWTHARVRDVICEIVWVPCSSFDALLGTGMILAPIYEQAVEGGGLPLHAGLVELNGRAYLLAGPAETGKTTCCTSIPSPWRCLCDDEALLVRDVRGRWTAHPFPTWSHIRNGRSDSTWNVQAHFPLGGVFFLKQSSQDRARPLGQGDASMRIFGSAKQVLRRSEQKGDPRETRQQRLKLFDNACRLAVEVPIYELCASLGGSFWEEMERCHEGALSSTGN